MRDQTFEDCLYDFQEVVGDQTANLYRNLIIEEFEEFNEAFLENKNDAEVLKELVDLIYVSVGFATIKGWDLHSAFNRVHENNMGRMYQPDGTIKRRADGKIEKNKSYPKVQLGDLV